MGPWAINPARRHCRYEDPPMRDRTMERLADALKDLEREKKLRKLPEKETKSIFVDCPVEGPCTKRMKVEDLTDHLEFEHYEDEVLLFYNEDDEVIYGPNLTVPTEAGDRRSFLAVFKYKDHTFYARSVFTDRGDLKTWLCLADGGPEEAGRFRAKFSHQGDHGADLDTAPSEIEVCGAAGSFKDDGPPPESNAAAVVSRGEMEENLDLANGENVWYVIAMSATEKKLRPPERSPVKRIFTLCPSSS